MRKPREKTKTNREVTIRCYCHGFGDSFLLTFDPDGTPFRVVIDCGLLLNSPNEKERMIEVVQDIHTATGGKIDVLAITHEHYDHLCGFNHADALWQTFDIGELWMAWTENPTDPDARKISKEKENLNQNLQLAFQSVQVMSESGQRLASLLGFSENTRQARDFVVSLAKAKDAPVFYWDPGQSQTIKGGLADALFLGPPKDPKKLRKTETDTKQVQFSLAFALDSRVDGQAAPASYENYIRQAMGLNRPNRPSAFNRMYESDDVDPRWVAQENSWRRIGYNSGDRATEGLALQLASLTNNTSLAIAFRLKSGRILLFPGDAQGGNWNSWSDNEASFGPIQILMERTVFYKVGHHGSHNGTFLANRYDSISKDAAVFMPFEPTAKWPSIPFEPLTTSFAKHKDFISSQTAENAGKEGAKNFSKGPVSPTTKRPLWVEWSC